MYSVYTTQPLSKSQCGIVAGPPGNARVEACKLLVTSSELEEYTNTEAVSVALLVPSNSGYDVWFVSRVDDSFTVLLHDTVTVSNEMLTYVSSVGNDKLTLEEVLELARRSKLHDLVAAKHVYGHRDCTVRDANYPTMHVLVDLERTYADLLTEFENNPSWKTAVDLLAFVSLSVLVLGDLDLTKEWNNIHGDVVNTFSKGANVNGEREELNTFVDRIGDILLVVRQLLEA